MRAVSLLVAIAYIALLSPGHAQTAGPNDRMKIDITRGQLQTIGQGLMELPYKTAAPLLQDLQGQLVAHDAAVAEALKPKPEAKPEAAPEEPAKP